jgi:hypothetical protein
MNNYKVLEALERINGTVLIATMEEDDELYFMKTKLFNKDLYEQDYNLVKQFILKENRNETHD